MKSTTPNPLSPTLKGLPVELKLQILANLSVDQLYPMRLVDKEFDRVACTALISGYYWEQKKYSKDLSEKDVWIKTFERLFKFNENPIREVALSYINKTHLDEYSQVKLLQAFNKTSDQAFQEKIFEHVKSRGWQNLSNQREILSSLFVHGNEILQRDIFNYAKTRYERGEWKEEDLADFLWTTAIKHPLEQVGQGIFVHATFKLHLTQRLFKELNTLDDEGGRRRNDIFSQVTTWQLMLKISIFENLNLLAARCNENLCQDIFDYLKKEQWDEAHPFRDRYEDAKGELLMTVQGRLDPKKAASELAVRRNRYSLEGATSTKVAHGF
jgi:hypothetical protein